MQSLTREAIKRTYLRMLNERSPERITVKAIAEECGINRNTFYYHFTDITELLSEIITDAADSIIKQHASANSLEQCLAAATQFARENKNAVMAIYRSMNRNLYEQHLIRICHYVILSYAQKAFGDLQISPGDQEVLVRFYQCELIGQTLMWLESNMRYDIQGQFARLCELQKGLFLQMIDRCIEENS